MFDRLIARSRTSPEAKSVVGRGSSFSLGVHGAHPDWSGPTVPTAMGAAFCDIPVQAPAEGGRRPVTCPPFVAPAFFPSSHALTAPGSAEDPLEREADRVGAAVMTSASDGAHAILGPSASMLGRRNSPGFALGCTGRKLGY